MFRESDYQERVLHPSYTNKPKPTLQLHSQASKLDDSGRSMNAFRDGKRDDSIPAVPSSWDSYYDPSHPDADWTGLVSKSTNHRKHVADHSSLQSGIVQTENGLISREERQEWTHRRQPDGPVSKNESHFQIAGINEDQDRWKTTYNRFEGREQTNRDQMTLEKRTRPMKMIPDPAQARSLRDQLPRPEYSPRGEWNESPREQSQSHSQSLVGYRAPTFTKKSMISSIGFDIADRIEEPAPRVSQKPKRTADTLLTQNYNPAPGYTGRRQL